MIDVQQAITDKFPSFSERPELIRKTTLNFLKKITHESEINAFLKENSDLNGVDFIEAVFEYFNFTYSASLKDKQNIPSQGRVVIIANHPIGSLDGLALLRQILEVRPDVKIVANDMLMMFPQLNEFFIPVNNMTGKSFKAVYDGVTEALNKEQAVIIFPAGEVSRTSPTGIKDSRWRFGFINFARKTQSPILPIHVKGKNSALFYSVSIIAKPLSTALLSSEMFKQRNRSLIFTVGELIPCSEINQLDVSDKSLVKRLKKHLYKLPKLKKSHKPNQFSTQKTISHPEDRQRLLAAIKGVEKMGDTKNGFSILLANYYESNVLMKEIGRLREVAFRMVGEGTGKKRDLDSYDKYYQHLVLWNKENLDLVGAYRLGDCRALIGEYGLDGLYTSTLFDFEPAMNVYLNNGLELGRSFINPTYWGKSSLGYLWQGIGCYRKNNPHIRYLIGPVSMSDRFPKALRDKLIYFFKRFYSGEEQIAHPKNEYTFDEAEVRALEIEFSEHDAITGMVYLIEEFKRAGHTFPVLFKQYTSLFEKGGFRILSFSVDPEFANCIDGLILADMDNLKETKRQRFFSGSV